MVNFFSFIKISFNKITGWTRNKLLIRVFFYYLGILLLASILLMFPWSWNKDSISISFLDAFYTATSAISTTGLTIYDISEDMSLFGQSIIFLLILIGGFGLIFFKIKIFKTVRYFFIKSKHNFIDDHEQHFERGYFNPKISKDMLQTGFLTLMAVYILGFLCFFIYFAFVPIGNLNYHKEIDKGLWVALFHSVSATNNAGFDIFQDGTYFNSLEVMNEHIFIQLISIFQFLIGGFGFIVFLELWEKFRSKIKKTENWKKLNFAKMIVTFYVLTIVFSVVLIMFFEATKQKKIFHENNWMKIIFNTLSSRSAGFSTVDIKEYFSESSKYLLSILMWIGCAPLSTGGGIKITTFVIAFWAIFGKTDSQNNLTVFKKNISQGDVAFTYKVCFFSMLLIVITSIIVGLNIQNHSGSNKINFSDSLFYSTSALGNVGLNTFKIVKNDWETLKIMSILIMLVGQIGIAQTIQYQKTKETKSDKQPYSISQKIPF